MSDLHPDPTRRPPGTAADPARHVPPQQGSGMGLAAVIGGIAVLALLAWFLLAGNDAPVTTEPEPPAAEMPTPTPGAAPETEPDAVVPPATDEATPEAVPDPAPIEDPAVTDPAPADPGVEVPAAPEAVPETPAPETPAPGTDSSP